MGTTINGIIYRVLVETDIAAVLDIYENTMIYEEPGYRAMGMKAPDDTVRLVDVFLPSVLNSGLSIGAFDADTKELVGFRLCNIQRSTDDPDAVMFDVQDPSTEKFAKIEKCTKNLFEGLDLFELADTNEIVKFHGLAVKCSHRKRGIGGHLVDEAIRLSRENGYKAIVVEASSNYSRAIFNKLKFETIKTVPTNELHADGIPLYTDKLSTWPHMVESIHMLKL